MTEDDYVLRAAQARELGLSVSGLCERLVLDGKIDMSMRPAYRAMNPAYFAELRRIGNNVNQIAHVVNNGLPPDQTFAWKSLNELLTALLADELQSQRTAAVRNGAVANDPPSPQARDIFQRSVQLRPARRG